MSESPTVSVIMSVHNDAPYLRNSVESILRQDGVSFEFIVVDDGSTDDSGEILDTYAAIDSRLRVVHQSNQGLTKSLLDGCALARGKYIARQDSDDISFPGRLRSQASELDSHLEAVVVSCRLALMGPGGELLLYEFSDREQQDANDKDDTFCHGSLMFRRDAYERIGGYRREFRVAQDVDLQLRLRESGRGRFLPELLYAYRIDEDSISAGSPIQKRLARLAAAARDARTSGNDESHILAEALRLSSDQTLRTRSEPGTGNYFIGRCLYAQRDRRAIRYLRASCRRHIFSPRNWVALTQALVFTRSTNGSDVTLSGVLPRLGLNGRAPGVGAGVTVKRLTPS